MSENNFITLEDAKQQLDNLMKLLNKSTRENLFSYTVQKWMSMKIGDNDDEDNDNCNGDDDGMIDDPMDMLNSIVEEIRPKLPVSGIFPSETLLRPEKGKNSVEPKGAIYVDAFLYSDDELNDLEKEGKAATHYCGDCGSKNTKPLSTFTHSLSRDDLYYIFNTLLPVLPGKTVLDVGSRLGAVLYSAYVFTDAAKIIGIEMNKDFCKIQNEIIKKFKMEKRIQIFHKRIEEVADILETADIVILNNVFEFFLPESEQVNVWNFLKQHIKKGAYIVTRPHIDISLENINSAVSINIDNWVKQIDTDTSDQSKNLFETKFNEDNADEFSKIACYKVL